MQRFKKYVNITGLVVLLVSMVVYFYSVERTGSLWDCGEFILGAYKMQVVHPPGAPLFLMTGRMFAALGDMFSDNPEHIAMAVNLMSALFSALSAMMICWITMILGKLSLNGRKNAPDNGDLIALCGAGLAAGLATAFSTSIWFSAVEGEVYAMSTFFSVLTFWAMVKWYNLPNESKYDKWVVFAIYAAGLSLGVHLLSLLAFPVMALLYYFKKYDKTTWTGVLASFGIGVAMIVFVQKVIIVGIPMLWSKFELIMVNDMGLPFHSGIFPCMLVLAGIVLTGIMYSKKNKFSLLLACLILTTLFLFVSSLPLGLLFTAALIFVFMRKEKIVANGKMTRELVGIGAFSFALLIISFMSMGSVVIRANASTPINMNEPSDVMRLIPYLNREQYGDRALVMGPNFGARPVKYDREDRYGRVGDRYEVVSEKVTAQYAAKDKTLFPRMQDGTQGRPAKYRQWVDLKKGKDPSLFDNIHFFLEYQVGWMYWRYFMWNFSGRQNGTQGFYSWDPAKGKWISGIQAVDNMGGRTFKTAKMPERMKTDAARNTYFLLPFIFGMLGMLFHVRKRKREFFALLGLFFITGIGIILYTNQPPNEPRERDYVLVGSFFTFCVWIGLGVLYLRELLLKFMRDKKEVAAVIASAIVLSAPLIMGFQNFDDHSRKDHKGARDYATNFLNSVKPDGIIFTYGDNDTYPLWYAQEVEGIRPDVRVINLSLIAVDWYINQMSRRVNESPAIKFTIPNASYVGTSRNQMFFHPKAPNNQKSAKEILTFIGGNNPIDFGNIKPDSYIPNRSMFIPIDESYARSSGAVAANDKVVSRIPISFGKKQYLTKDEVAILDIISSNINDRPIYFSVTCQPSKLMGLKDYTKLEGLALRVVPKKTESEQNLIYFYGDIDTDVMYDNVVNKWKWGNFDKKKLHVNHSYGATLQAMKLTMTRLCQDLSREQKTEKAAVVAKKYLEAFPQMNFKYDSYTSPFLRALLNNGEIDEAKKHLSMMAEELEEYMIFYNDIGAEDLNAGFAQQYSFDQRALGDAIQIARAIGDENYTKEINDRLARFQNVNMLRG